MLGWELKPGESHLDAILSVEILSALIVFVHDITKDEASRNFLAFLHDRNTSLFPPNVRKVGCYISWILESFVEFILLFMIIELMIASSIYGWIAESKQI